MDFYATSHDGYPTYVMPRGYHWLFAASSWYDSKRGLRTLELPLHIDKFAVDCGGFVAARIWGEYRYTANQYVNWIHQFLLPPQWAAIQDFCCEDEITAGKTGIVRERQQRTTAKVEKFYRDYRHEQWCWIPTVQGWQVSDYIDHAIELKPLITQWQKFYAARGQADIFRVGIGTLCARPYTADIQAIVCAVAEILPAVQFHLWGVKLQVLKSATRLPRITSVDSAAWNGLFGKDRHPAREQYTSMTVTKSWWELNIALPKYMAKVNAAMEKPKLLTLWHGSKAA